MFKVRILSLLSCTLDQETADIVCREAAHWRTPERDPRQRYVSLHNISCTIETLSYYFSQCNELLISLSKLHVVHLSLCITVQDLYRFLLAYHRISF